LQIGKDRAENLHRALIAMGAPRDARMVAILSSRRRIVKSAAGNSRKFFKIKNISPNVGR
jgi:hypothetical protein